MVISKIKAIWAAIVRKLNKLLHAQADVTYPFDRVERLEAVDHHRDERLARYF